MSSQNWTADTGFGGVQRQLQFVCGPTYSTTVTALYISEIFYASYQGFNSWNFLSPMWSQWSGSSSGGGSGKTQQQPPNNGIKAKVCSVIPSGRTEGVSGGIGGVGSVGRGAEVVVNYNSGQTSAFAFGGLQLGWNGVVSGSVYSGFVYGLNSSNSNDSGGFTGVNGGAGIGGFAASSSGGMTHGVAGLSPTGGVRAAGLSLGAGLLGGFSGGVSPTNYTNSLQLGKFAAFTPVDFLLYAVRQVCN